MKINIFFFSSRRRHTRSKRDWSSDVCSSDLGEYLFIAGMLAPGADFDAQCGGVFAQIAEALKSAGAGWANVVQFTTYLVHSQDIAKFMQFRLREFPRMFPNGAYPPNTLLIIDRLVGEQYLLEVQTVAAL